MQISVSSNVKAARLKLNNYAKRQLPNAVTKALNRTLRGTITDTKKLIAKRINLSQKEIATELRTNFATAKNGGNAYVATMTVKGGFKRNMASFKGLRKTKKGLSGKVWKKSTKYPGAFVWERGIASGGIAKTAFMRDQSKGKVVPERGKYKGRKIKRGPRAGQAIKRQPLKPIYGDSVVLIFTRKGRRPTVQKLLTKTVPKRFAKAFAHQLTRIK